MLTRPLDDDDHQQGDRDAADALLMYGDYECPYTRKAYREVGRLLRQRELRFAFRHFPLTRIHPHALRAAEAAEAAALQDRFWEMSDRLFRGQSKGELGDDAIRAHAEAAGLDPERFEHDWTSDGVRARVQADLRSALADGADKTPTLFLNGERYEGSLEPEAFPEDAPVS